jgi:hypothetical protein
MAQASPLNKTFESVLITVNGVQKTYHTVYSSWVHPSVHDSSVSITQNGRLYYSSESDSLKQTPESLFAPKLLGGSISYDVDMSTVTCGCIAAIYLVGAPAINSSG